MIHKVRIKIRRVLRESSILFRLYALLCRLFGSSKKEMAVLSNMDMKMDGSYLSNFEDFLKDDDIATRKRILLVSHEFSLTGAPLVLITLAEALKKRGYKVIVTAPLLIDDRYISYASSKNISAIVCPDIITSNMIGEIRRYFSFIVCNTVETAPVIRSLCDTDTEVIWWIHEGFSSYSRREARQMPGFLPENIHVYTPGSYSRNILLSRFPKYSVKNLIYYSPDLKEKLNGGVAVSSELVEMSRNKKVYAIVGGLDWRKGVDILLNAIEKLPKKIINNSLILFIGNQSDSKIRKGLLELKRQYPNNIHLTGSLAPEEVYACYSIVDYLICSSRDDPMPVVIAEAMSMGIPCICSENTGSAAIIKKYKAGFVFNNNSSDLLAKKITSSFYINDSGHDEMSQNARRSYENIFSINTFEKKIDRIFGE